MSLASRLRNTAVALAIGMKNADTEMFSNVQSGVGKEVIMQQNQHIFQDMLQGKVTKQVQEYRMKYYLLLRESNRKQNKSVSMLNCDRYDTQSVEFGMEVKTISSGFSMLNENINNTKMHCNISFEHNDESYMLENYINKLIVRKLTPEYRILEFYVSKYANDEISQYITSHLQNIMHNPMITPLLNISQCGFVTENAYGVEDFTYYEYKMTSLYKIIEHNGCYVIKYIVEPLVNGEDILMTKYYDEDVATNYMSQKAFKSVF